MIRSITIGVPVFSHSLEVQAERLSDFSAKAARALEQMGTSARTLRLTLPALADDTRPRSAIHSMLQGVDRLSEAAGARWACLPFDLVGDAPSAERLGAALDCVREHPRIFMNLIVAREGEISVEGAYHAGRLILKAAALSNNGFDNFRIGASCCCPANAPFFPFSRHEGDDFAFSFAMETTPLALEIAEQAGRERWTLSSLRDALANRLASALAPYEELALHIAKETGFAWRGMDASYAPFPDGKTSVGRLVEMIGTTPGALGGVFVTSLLTDALKEGLRRGGITKVGFNGVMYSVLEDERLAQVNGNRGLSMHTLMALASVCSCGIDMVPVPGTMFPEEIGSLILDLAAMAVRLRKPLGIRVLPIRNRSTNERTGFNLDFLCDSRVMDIGQGETFLEKGDRIWNYRCQSSG
jgi:uncharacterized protein